MANVMKAISLEPSRQESQRKTISTLFFSASKCFLSRSFDLCDFLAIRIFFGAPSAVATRGTFPTYALTLQKPLSSVKRGLLCNH